MSRARAPLVVALLVLSAVGCGGDDEGWMAVQLRGSDGEGRVDIDAVSITHDDDETFASDSVGGTDVENDTAARGAPDGDCDEAATFMTMTGDQSRATLGFDGVLAEGDTITVSSLSCGTDAGTFSVHVALSTDLQADHVFITECTSGQACTATVPEYVAEE